MLAVAKEETLAPSMQDCVETQKTLISQYFTHLFAMRASSLPGDRPDIKRLLSRFVLGPGRTVTHALFWSQTLG